MKWFFSKQLGPFKKHIVVTGLLDRLQNDSCVLTYRANQASSIQTQVIRYDAPFKVPANFKTVHGEFKDLDNGLLYFRISSWDESIFLRVINNWDRLRRSKGLVIDLRGNGGGEITAAVQLFSLFINRPTTYFNFVGDANHLDPVMVLPDAEYSYPVENKVMIIGDKLTACTSESFIKAMQNCGRARFISFTHSMGSFAARFDIQMPSGIIIHTNAIHRKTCLNSPNETIEGVGAAPDLQPVLTSVFDLKPYNDKLLQEAVKILSADKRDLPKTVIKE